MRFLLRILPPLVVSILAAINTAAEPAPTVDATPIPSSIDNVLAKQRANHEQQAKRLAADGKIDEAEALLCPGQRKQNWWQLAQESQALITAARQLVEDEKGLNAILLVERAQQRLEQIENSQPQSEKPIRLVTALQKAYLFDRILFDKERAYLAYQEVLRISPENIQAKARVQALEALMETLRFYGTTTPALNRAFAATGSNARMEMVIGLESVGIRVLANNKAAHRLETSTDLVNWSPVVSGLRTGDSFRHQVPDERECRFYRLWRESFDH